MVVETDIPVYWFKYFDILASIDIRTRMMSKGMDQVWEYAFRIRQGACIRLCRKLSCLGLMIHLDNITKVVFVLPI